MQLYRLTAHQLHDLLVKREISAEEINNAVFQRIDEVDGEIKAFITLTKEKAMEQAREVDRQIQAGEAVGSLAGIPVAIKDNICTKDILTTAASKMLENFVPPYDATVIEKLATAQVTMLGKTNLDEFAMGSTTESSVFGATRNPWNKGRVPGGSSGGSAAAVAAGEAICALGTDTGGSIRQPAAFCGVVGLKPTYGVVSRYGAIGAASSMDTIGPITKDVTDCAIMLQAISGYDRRDSTSANTPVPDYTGALVSDVKGLKIGVPKEYMDACTSTEVRNAIENAMKQLESLGAVVEYTSLPYSEYALPTYQIIGAGEASSNMARFDGVRFGYRATDASDVYDMFTKSRTQSFGQEVKKRMILGTYALSAGCYDIYYLQAMKVRTLIKQDFTEALAKFDLLMSPVTPQTAYTLGELAANPELANKADYCTIGANLAGIPALSLPCGMVDGLPVGLQLMGKYYDEKTLLRVAYTFEQSTDYHKEFPEL